MRVETIGPSTEQMGRSIAEWVKAETIKAAFDVLPREVRKGFDNEPVVITDGVVRRDPRQVKPFGKIEFVARTNMWQVVQWIMAELFRRSPVKTGAYRQGHMLMINGAEVKGNLRAALQKVKPGDRVQVVNPLPYARKIEVQAFKAAGRNSRGRIRRRAQSRQAPQGVYKPVVRSAVQRWGKSVYLEYKLVKLNLGVKVWGDQGGRYRKDGSKTFTRRVQRDQVYPAIQIFVKPGQTVH